MIKQGKVLVVLLNGRYRVVYVHFRVSHRSNLPNDLVQILDWTGCKYWNFFGNEVFIQTDLCPTEKKCGSRQKEPRDAQRKAMPCTLWFFNALHSEGEKIVSFDSLWWVRYVAYNPLSFCTFVWSER